MSDQAIKVLAAFLLVAFWLGVATCARGAPCEEPLSDADLLKYYKPCYGSAGWCLRDKYK